MTSTLKAVPTYTLATLCLSSAVVRMITVYNGTIANSTSTSSSTSTTSAIDLPGIAQSFLLFPASSNAISSLLGAALIDFICAVLVINARTRFFASGTVLVLLGMSAGGTLSSNNNNTNNDNNNLMGESGQTTSTTGTSNEGTFEIAVFKLMVANVATLSAWRDSRITSRIVDSVQGKTKTQDSSKSDLFQPDLRSKNKSNSTSKSKSSTNPAVVGVHERLR